MIINIKAKLWKHIRGIVNFEILHDDIRIFDGSLEDGDFERSWKMY